MGYMSGEVPNYKEDEGDEPTALHSRSASPSSILSNEATMAAYRAVNRHTKNEWGCFQAAEDDEPVFTLRAKDALAPTVILFWCSLLEQAQSAEGFQTKDEFQHLQDKLVDARHCARAMIEWQRANTHKVPDWG